MKKWKATLWETPRSCGSPIPKGIKGLNQFPVDTVLLTKKCYSTAEDIFFTERHWGTREREHLHIEIEELPRIVETGA